MTKKLGAAWQRFCERCEQWVTPRWSPATLYHVTTYDEICPSCTYAVNFSGKRAVDIQRGASAQGGDA